MSSIDRPAHVLKAEKTLAIPRHVIFFDCETYMTKLPDGSVSHSLKLGWACYTRKAEHDRPPYQEWLEFTTSEGFFEFVLSKSMAKNKLWVVAHNLSFDFTIVNGFKYLRDTDFTCQFFYSSGATTLIKVKKKRHSIIFVDSLNWFKESLETIGKRVGVPKMSIDFDTCDMKTLSTYCKRDVEILVRVFEHLTRFLTSNRISRLCYTIGSTSMAAYLFRHYSEKIYIHNNKEAITLERASYKGGRTECFFIGELTYGPYFVVDVNSLYPFVMKTNLFPVKYKKIIHNPSLKTLASTLKIHAVVARVLLDTQSPRYALRAKRTLFPVGTFTTTLTTPDLIEAIINRDIKEVYTMVVYEQAKIFTGFVDRFYKIRKEFARADNQLFEHFCKILLNSLYGKFGQKAEEWTKVGLCPNEPDRIEDIIDATTHRRKRLRYLLGEIHELTSHGEAMHSFPAIASHVTAYARAYLWELIMKCGRKNCYYCDTDSLFVNQKGLDNLTEYLDNDILGMLKIEYQTDTITIHGLKDYVTDKKKVVKGIRKSATVVSDTDYIMEIWPTLKGLLRVSAGHTYITKRQLKHLSREYTKGIISPSGYTLPFDFDGFVESL